ncbi:hypothetical protein Tco_1265533 [Tanacetum coccineum]
MGKPQQDDTGFVNSGCSRHMTGNIAYLSDFKEFDGGYVKHIEYRMLNASPLKNWLKITTARQKLVLLSTKVITVEALFEGRLLIYIVKAWMEGYVISKVGDEAIHKELGDRMERAATTSSSLEAEQDNGNIK